MEVRNTMWRNLNYLQFQCINGHLACSDCCAKIKRKCPTCGSPTVIVRNWPIEKVIELVQVNCKNAEYGCQQKMSFSKKRGHEKTCHILHSRARFQIAASLVVQANLSDTSWPNIIYLLCPLSTTARWTSTWTSMIVSCFFKRRKMGTFLFSETELPESSGT